MTIHQRGRRGAITLLIVALLGGISACERAGATIAPRSTPTPVPSATPTITPAPSITPTPAFSFNTLRLRETFDSPQHTTLRAGNNQRASSVIAGGGYTIHVDDPDALVWSSANSVFADAAVSVNVRLQRGAKNTALGVIFRQQDNDNFYFFGVTADGNYALNLLQDGTWKPIIDWTESPAINGFGESNILRVEAAGERVRLYVNGTLLDEVSDTTFTQGTVALAVHTFDTGDVTARFDYLMVETP